MINRFKESVVYQLISYFSERYFSVSFHRYEHIPLGPSANRSAQMIILAAVIALIMASVIITVTKARQVRFVRKLLKGECFSTATAKTLAELGEFRSTFLRRELSRGGTLRRCVYCAREDIVEASDAAFENGSATAEVAETADLEKKETAEDPSETAEQKALRMHEKNRLSGEGKLDFTTARFYIPKELKYFADVRFERRGFGWLTVLLTVALSLVGAALICHFLPDFIQLLDNLITMTAPQ
ncbi:MAG: hypothetical protein E7643_01110 [Ruminococcaceae bacterium]|nr:hypothetical protein [Oscillospiraceae bacterium]